VRWPWSAEELSESWGRGPIPDQAVGIVHTHPNRISPLPSTRAQPSDRTTARDLRMPVYVLHRKGIWKIEPGARKPSKVEDARWRERIFGVRRTRTRSARSSAALNHRRQE
jgi:hypothetical protein